MSAAADVRHADEGSSPDSLFERQRISIQSIRSDGLLPTIEITVHPQVWSG